MRSKSFLVVAAILVALLVAAGAVYAYDSSRDNLIAKGVRVGGIDVGGLRAGQARAKLRAALLAPLSRPVTATYRDRSFTLTPRQARVGVDIDRSVAEALRRSRSGGIIDRTVRGLTGGRVDADLRVDISYDRAAVDAVVRRVQRALDRRPVDARLDLAGGRVATTASHTGLQVRSRTLGRDLATRLVDPRGERTVAIAARTVAPKVSSRDLARRYPAIIIVNRSAFRLTLYKHLKPARTFTIAVGRVGLETPAGLYHIQDKQVNPSWHVPNSAWAGKLAGKVIPPGPDDPIKARWMGIFDGAGIHGTDELSSLGSAASHGCIRMAIPDVEALYDQVSVGDPVYIS
jgi:lipoprotein-anchoring transpeptidase ErfK/SrfK